MIEAACEDAGQPLPALRVDGGMARNSWFLQCQADLLGLPVIQSPHVESTALGAAFLAGLKSGLWPDIDALRRLPQEGRHFEPRLPAADREGRRTEWQRAVQAVIGYYKQGPS